MPTAQQPSTAVAKLSTQDITAKVGAKTLAVSLAQEVSELKVTTNSEYAYADSLLGRVRTAQKSWGGVWARIQEKSIKPLRASLEGLYEVNREIEKPLTDLEESIKKLMKSYKMAEAKRLNDEAAAKAAEVRRLQAEADAKAAAALNAKTAQMRGKLEAARIKLETQAAAVQEEEVDVPVLGVDSGTRKVPAWRLVYDDEHGSHLAEFLLAIINGTVPADAVLLNDKFINARFKAKPEEVASWPGIEVYDDIQIVGR